MLTKPECCKPVHKLIHELFMIFPHVPETTDVADGRLNLLEWGSMFRKYRSDRQISFIHSSRLFR